MEQEPRNILEKIVRNKYREVDIARQKLPLEHLKARVAKLPPCRDFLAAIKGATPRPAVIAEVKRASPSKGVLREDFDPVAIARGYVEGGAACLSVLTERVFFQGGFEVLAQVRQAVDIPILCKDFILLPYQLFQARDAGADAALLIAAILSDQDLVNLEKAASSIGLFCLVEVHNAAEMERVLRLDDISLIGINNRNLSSFETDLVTTEVLMATYGARLHQRGVMLVSESGLSERADLDLVQAAGVDAVLVGEALIRQKDVAKALQHLQLGGAEQEQIPCQAQVNST